MKWTVKLVAEGRSSVEHEVITIERGESISPGTIGLTIAEGKVILEGLQRQVVVSQVQEHNVARRGFVRNAAKHFEARVIIDPHSAAFMAMFQCVFAA